MSNCRCSCLKKYNPGDGSFVYNASVGHENISFASNYYRFISEFNDGTVKITDLTFYLHSGGVAERVKPVICLYPAKNQNVMVNVKPEGSFSVTIPEIGDGLNVTATPGGKSVTGRSMNILIASGQELTLMSLRTGAEDLLRKVPMLIHSLRKRFPAWKIFVQLKLTAMKFQHVRQSCFPPEVCGPCSFVYDFNLCFHS